MSGRRVVSTRKLMQARRDSWFEQSDWLNDVRTLRYWRSGWVLAYSERKSYVEDFRFHLVTMPGKRVDEVITTRWGRSILDESNPPLFRIKKVGQCVSPQIRQKYGLARIGHRWSDSRGNLVIKEHVNEEVGKFRHHSIWVKYEFLSVFLAETKQIPLLWFCSERYSEKSLRALGRSKSRLASRKITSGPKVVLQMFLKVTAPMKKVYPRLKSWSSLQGRFPLAVEG